MKKTLLVLTITLLAVSSFARPPFPYRSMTIYFGSYGAGIDETLLKDTRALVGRFIKYGKVTTFTETRSAHAFEGERTLCITPTNPQNYYKFKTALEALLSCNPRSAFPVYSVVNEMEECAEVNNRIGPA